MKISTIDIKTDNVMCKFADLLDAKSLLFELSFLFLSLAILFGDKDVLADATLKINIISMSISNTVFTYKFLKITILLKILFYFKFNLNN